jgi:hypothetical protein
MGFVVRVTIDPKDTKRDAHLRRADFFGFGTDSIAAKISLEDEVEIKRLIVTFWQAPRAGIVARRREAQ